MKSKRAKNNDNLETLDLKISDPVLLLNEIARRYESTERILMEYVDNALDDAEALYRENNYKYPYHITIEVIIDPSSRTVTVRDNCRGMSRDTLERIVQNVGESQKRGLTWVNGRFGFGVQAFRAAADAICFQTKHKDSDHLKLVLHRNQHTNIQRAQVIADAFPTNTGTGSMVILSDFEEEWFENLTVDSVCREIESHFERLLARPRLQITVREKGKKAVRCQAFRYRKIPGQTIQRTLNLAFNDKKYPVEVHLKITETEVPGRGVRFFARGRRINYVSEIKSFIRKSSYRTSVWGHPNLLGYIEVGEIVRPVITRDDFVRHKGRAILYDALLEMEEEIKDALDKINEARRDTTLSRLETVLRKVLANIAREDRQQLRQQTTSPLQVRPRPPISPKAVRRSVNTAAKFHKLTGNGNGQDAQNGSNGKLLDVQAGIGLSQPSNSGSTGHNASTENGEHTPPRRRRGFDIQFFDIPPDASGQVKRSYMADNTIYINVGHPDFQERIAYTRQGQPRITDRLGAYIAATVSIHYKDQFYSKYGSIPERRDLLFDEQVDFIFRLESALREYLPELEKELARQKQQEPVAG